MDSFQSECHTQCTRRMGMGHAGFVDHAAHLDELVHHATVNLQVHGHTSRA